MSLPGALPSSGSGVIGVPSQRPRERPRRSWTVLVSGVPRSGSSEVRRPFLVLISGPGPVSLAYIRKDRESGIGVPGQSSSAAFLVPDRQKPDVPTRRSSQLRVRRHWRSFAKTARAASAFLDSPRQRRSSFRIVRSPKALPRPDLWSGSGVVGVHSQRPRERHRRSWTVLVSGVPRSGSSEARCPYPALFPAPGPASLAFLRKDRESGLGVPGQSSSAAFLV